MIRLSGFFTGSNDIQEEEKDNYSAEKYNYERKNLNIAEIKAIVGHALCLVDGVLGLKKGKKELSNTGNEYTRGINVRGTIEDGFSVTAEIILDLDSDEKAVSAAAEDTIRAILSKEKGIENFSLEIIVADYMTEMEYQDRYDYQSSIY